MIVLNVCVVLLAVTVAVNGIRDGSILDTTSAETQHSCTQITDQRKIDCGMTLFHDLCVFIVV
jgi:hypothetical protein